MKTISYVKNVPTMLNTQERVEEQKLYIQIFVSSSYFFSAKTLKQKCDMYFPLLFSRTTDRYHYIQRNEYFICYFSF